jgi:hypothetical protein
MIEPAERYFLDKDVACAEIADEVFDAIGVPDKMQDLPLKVWRETFHYNMIRREEDKT